MSVINEQIYQLISNLTFDEKDPFDLHIKDFPKILLDLDPDVQKKFYENILIWLCKEDRAGGLAYELVSNKILNGDYGTLDYSSKNYKDVASILKKISIDEYEHAEFDEFLYQQIYKRSYDKTISNIECEALARLVARESLENMLLIFYIGECHTWALQYNFIKFSNSNKKDILKAMIAEEHSHITILEQIILTHFKKFDKRIFIGSCANQRYPIISYTEDLLQIYDYDQKNIALIESSYNSEWFIHFKSVFLVKVFKIFNLLFPAHTYEKFCSDIDNCKPSLAYRLEEKKLLKS